MRETKVTICESLKEGEVVCPGEPYFTEQVFKKSKLEFMIRLHINNGSSDGSRILIDGCQPFHRRQICNFANSWENVKLKNGLQGRPNSWGGGGGVCALSCPCWCICTQGFEALTLSSNITFKIFKTELFNHQAISFFSSLSTERLFY